MARYPTNEVWLSAKAFMYLSEAATERSDDSGCELLITKESLNGKSKNKYESNF